MAKVRHVNGQKKASHSKKRTAQAAADSDKGLDDDVWGASDDDVTHQNVPPEQFESAEEKRLRIGRTQSANCA